MIFYYKCVQVLKSHSELVLSAIQLRVKDLYIYLVFQVLTFGPCTMYSISIIVFPMADIYPWNKIAIFLLGFTGFADSFVYFFQRKGATKKEQTDDLHDVSTIVNPRDSADMMLFNAAIGRFSMPMNIQMGSCRTTLNSNPSFEML